MAMTGMMLPRLSPSKWIQYLDEQKRLKQAFVVSSGTSNKKQMLNKEQGKHTMPKLYQRKEECVLVPMEQVDACGNRTVKLVLQKRPRDDPDSFELESKKVGSGLVRRSLDARQTKPELNVKLDGGKITVTAKSGLFSVGDLKRAGLLQ